MNIAVQATHRELGRPSSVKDMRNDGKIPAIIYRKGEESLPILLNEAVFGTEYRKSIGEVTFFIINIDGKEIKTIIKEKQIHPVSRRVRHIDFQQLVPGDFITLDIPVKYTGTPKGLESGGILEVLVRKIEVTCKSEIIPEGIKLDISELEVGQKIHFSDVKLVNLKSKLPGNTVLVQVKGARIQTEAGTEEGTVPGAGTEAGAGA